VLPARCFSFVSTLIDGEFWELLTPAVANFLTVFPASEQLNGSNIENGGWVVKVYLRVI
jgi:hypothetical protein